MLGAYVDKNTTDDTYKQYFAGTAIDKIAEGTEGDPESHEALNKYRRNCAWLDLVRIFFVYYISS